MAVPIVFAVAEDPVSLGLAASLARPGGNLTGVNYLNSELVAKRLGLLRDLVPGSTRVAVLVNPNTRAATKSTLREVAVAAPPLGCKSRCSRPAPAARSIRPSRASARAPRCLIRRRQWLFQQPTCPVDQSGGAPRNPGDLRGPYLGRSRRADELRSRHKTRGVKSASIPAASSRASRLRTCRSCSRPNSSWSSTTRPPACSASPSRRRCSPSPTR